MNARNVIVAMAVSTVLTGGVLAQTKTGSQQSGQTMSMDGMMKQCREHCAAASKSMDDTMRMMNDARQSNDVNKLRAAIDQMQKQMTGMKEHMSMCMSMMDMMQKMQGGASQKK